MSCASFSISQVSSDSIVQFGKSTKMLGCYESTANMLVLDLDTFLDRLIPPYDQPRR